MTYGAVETRQARFEPTSDDGKLFQVYDWSTFHGSISEVADPDVTSAHCTQTFVDLLTWPDWAEHGRFTGQLRFARFRTKILVYGWNAARME